MQKYLLIALGGALGSIARYWIGTTVASRLGTRFPYGTLIVNLSACAAIGFALAFLARRAGVSSGWFYLIPVGFVGAYSTFSTYEWEALSLLRAGAFMTAAVYAVVSVIVGLAAVWCGMMAGEKLG